jgi:hypothetical protein
MSLVGVLAAIPSFVCALFFPTGGRQGEWFQYLWNEGGDYAQKVAKTGAFSTYQAGCFSRRKKVGGADGGPGFAEDF